MTEQQQPATTCYAAKCTLPAGHGPLQDGATHELREPSPAPTTEPELRDVRIGSTEHFTLAATNMAPGAATLCGIRIAGTPVAPTGGDFCYDCQARMGCDECGHGVGVIDTHLWAPAAEEANPEAGRFIYDNATCWAEHICRECNPELYGQAVAMLDLSVTDAATLLH